MKARTSDPSAQLATWRAVPVCQLKRLQIQDLAGARYGCARQVRRLAATLACGAVLAVIFLILYFQFRDASTTVLVFSGVAVERT